MGGIFFDTKIFIQFFFGIFDSVIKILVSPYLHGNIIGKIVYMRTDVKKTSLNACENGTTEKYKE